MKPTDEQVERVARALCRLQVLRNVEIGAYKMDIERGVEMCWVHFQGEARAAIAAMPEPWMPIDDNTPADQDLQLGWWEKWPERAWMQRIGYARSTRGGWNDGRPTHWRHLPSPPQKDEQPSPATLLKP